MRSPKPAPALTWLGVGVGMLLCIDDMLLQSVSRGLLARCAAREAAREVAVEAATGGASGASAPTAAE